MAPPDAGELAQVAGAGLMVDDADDHEQRRLEHRVGQEHGEPGHRRVPGAQAVGHHEEAELGDRAVGEHELDVRLPQGAPAAEHQGPQADAEHQDLPGREVVELRGQAGHEEHAGLHHGRRVQVRGHGGGRGHGGREPEVERRLGRLGQGADQHERDGDLEQPAHPGVRHEGRGRLEDAGDPPGAGDVGQHDEAGEHGQAAERGDDQGGDGGAAGEDAVARVADQQEGQDRGDLPEGVEHHEVVRGHQAEHRAGEGQQLAAEHRVARLVLPEVAGAVGQDQRADSQHDQGHERGQHVHAEGELDVQVRHPRHAAVQVGRGGRDRPARVERLLQGEHVRQLGQEPHEAGGGDRGEEVEALTPRPAEHGRRGERDDEESGQGDEHGVPSSGRVRGLVPPYTMALRRPRLREPVQRCA
ncbi:hypothetical protein BW35_02145 [Micrococcus luteus]|nr:hypothetical protein BW35_02145 [Micrococcus luteus]